MQEILDNYGFLDDNWPVQVKTPMREKDDCWTGWMEERKLGLTKSRAGEILSGLCFLTAGVSQTRSESNWSAMLARRPSL
jgi:hypothetical protein